jgi:micrococcal nuclease
VRLKLWEKETRDNQQYHRLLAYVYLPDGRMLNRALIEEGYGYADPRYDHPLKRDFQQAMDEARRQGRGLWREARPEDFPDQYREELTRHQPAGAPSP